ncbi:MAG: hypothetical protein AAFQ64_19315 [Pseudomonadota bacterium]
MRSSLLFILFIAGCSNEANHLGNPFLLPVNALTSSTENAIYQQRRAAVEVIVKSEFDAIISDIQSGGGPTLTQAFDAASVPSEERATRAFQLNTDLGLYAGNPGALVTAIMVYGST